MFLAHISLFFIIIIGVTSCSSKCNVRMNNIESQMTNSLEGVILTIGGGNLYNSDECMGLRNNGRYFIINCSSLKDGCKSILSDK